MFKKLIPHRWISWQVLEIVCLLVFYVAFVVGVYSLCKGVWTFISHAQGVEQARRLYILAFVQASIICIVSATGVHVLKAFARVTAKTDKLTPKK